MTAMRFDLVSFRSRGLPRHQAEKYGADLSITTLERMIGADCETGRASLKVVVEADKG
ncbi:MAG: hypothetical protein AB1749_02955 [Pseudomonadota bacterium]